MDQKIEKQGRAVTQLRERYDTEFGKLFSLKQERLKLQQELSAPDVIPTELVLPRPNTVADETRKQMDLNFATNPAFVPQCVAERTNLDDEDDMDLTEKPPEELEQATEAPKIGDPDKTALLYGSIMTEADQQITNLTKAAGATAVQK